MTETVVVTTDGRRISAVIPWHGGQGPVFAKRVAGGRWSPKAKVWTYPLSVETCRELRQVFGAALHVSDGLNAWARAAIASEKALLAVANADPSVPQRLPRVEEQAPSVWRAMEARSYQTIGARFLADSGAALLADQPGLGKTLETFAAIIESGVRGCVLVVAPQTSLQPTWAAEVEKWLGEVGAEPFVVGPASPKKRREVIAAALASPARLRFLMINPEMCRTKRSSSCPADLCDGDDWTCSGEKRHKTVLISSYPELFAVRWAAIVADEVHKYLLRSNTRSRNVSLVGMGLQSLKTVEGGLRVAISGTPMKGRPRLLWPVFRWLRPDLYPSQWRWTSKYFVQEFDPFTGREVPTEELREDRTAAFNAEVSRMMMRRTKKELRDLNPNWAPPEKRYVEVWLEMSPKQTKAYRGIAERSEAALRGGTLMAEGVLAEMTRMRQFASCYGELVEGSFRPGFPSNKFDWLVGTFLPRHGITGARSTEDGDTKIVVASQFTQFIDLWADELERRGIPTHRLTGKTPVDARAAMVKDWQTPGGPRVMLLNTNAGGVSITLDHADDLVVMDETWVPDDQEQVEDRVHRTSRTDHQVTIHYVRSEGTIERDLAGSNAIKDDRQKRVLDGRRGIEWAKQIQGVTSWGS